jgi:DNA-binding CsgD family transcriptional regulator
MTGNTELSVRELEILRLVATGASNKEIAQKLFISTNTVKVHLRNIFSKIGVESRTEAAMYAVTSGILTTDQGLLNNSVQAGGFDSSINRDITVSEGAQIGVGKSESKLSRNRFWILITLLFAGMIILVIYLLVLPRIRLNQVNEISLSTSGNEQRLQILSSMPTARTNMAVVVQDDQIYVIAGKSTEGLSDLVEVYDIQKIQWRKLSPKPTRVQNIGAAVIGGKVYVPGGELESGQMTDTLEIFDPVKNIWVEGSRLPEKISSYAITSFEGRLYLFGGNTGNKITDTVFEYDPSTDQWIEKTPMPRNRSNATAANSGGRIYVIGGYDGKNALDFNDIYQPDQDIKGGHPWSQGKPLPEKRYSMGSAAIADFIHVIGGLGGINDDFISFQYVPISETWQSYRVAGLSTWSNLGVLSQGLNLYLVGGSIDGMITDQLVTFKAVYILNLPLILESGPNP